MSFDKKKDFRSNFKDCTIVQHAGQPCCSHRGHVHGCACAGAWAHGRPCVEAQPCASLGVRGLVNFSAI